MASFTHVAQDVSPQYGRVTKITIRVCVTDCTGTVYITDMLLQGGSIATGWVGHGDTMVFPIFTCGQGWLFL